MYNKLKVTYPNNFARFKCIGGECEDTCCQGWDIEIDKDTFDEYLKVQDQKMKAMLSDNIKKNNYCTSDDFKKYIDEVLDGFNINDIDNCGNDEERYISIFQEYTENFIKKYEYIFENYLVNYMYNNLFPFTESDDMLEGYIMLVVRYSFIRFYLVGRYINSKKESSENIIKMISLFARDIEHDKTYMSEIYDYIEKNQYDNMNFANKLL